MASLYAGPGSLGLDMTLASVGGYNFLTPTTQSSTIDAGDFRTLGDPNYFVLLFGSNFTYSGGPVPSGGTINRILELSSNQVVFDLVDMFVPASSFAGWVDTGNTNAAYTTIFAGNDYLQGTDFDDTLRGFGGSDVLNGLGGNDTAVYGGSSGSFTLQSFNGLVAVVPNAPSDPVDRLASIENVSFQGNGATVATSTATPFDGLGYIASYSDLRAAFGANAQQGFDHYVFYGHGEGRATTFDGVQYLASYGDLAIAYSDHGAGRTATDYDALGAQHYILYGAGEGRAEGFDAAQYFANYPDVAAAFGSNADLAAWHFVNWGYFEGRTDA
jgi:serralysin